MPPPPPPPLLLQDVKSYPVGWIKVVEKLDEGAFHRKHMFQIMVEPSGSSVLPGTPYQTALYLQAAVSPPLQFLLPKVGGLVLASLKSL